MKVFHCSKRQRTRYLLSKQITTNVNIFKKLYWGNSVPRQTCFTRLCKLHNWRDVPTKRKNVWRVCIQTYCVLFILSVLRHCPLTYLPFINSFCGVKQKRILEQNGYQLVHARAKIVVYFRAYVSVNPCNAQRWHHVSYTHCARVRPVTTYMQQTRMNQTQMYAVCMCPRCYMCTSLTRIFVYYLVHRNEVSLHAYKLIRIYLTPVANTMIKSYLT